MNWGREPPGRQRESSAKALGWEAIHPRKVCPRIGQKAMRLEQREGGEGWWEAGLERKPGSFSV